MGRIMKALEGRKTYVVAAALAVANTLVSTGMVHLSGSQLNLINAVLGALGLAALRAGVSKQS